MKRFNKITLIYTLHVIIVLGGVALASYLTYLSNGYFEDPDYKWRLLCDGFNFLFFFCLGIIVFLF